MARIKEVVSCVRIILKVQPNKEKTLNLGVIATIVIIVIFIIVIVIIVIIIIIIVIVIMEDNAQ